MNKEEKASDISPLFTSPIEAGFPSFVENDIDNRLNLNDFLIENKTATYFLRVKGNSMNGVGIFDEDILVVDKSKEPTSGKIIIACLNGEFTVKRLLIKNSKIYLKPENPQYKSILVTKECNFEVFGVVVYNIHKPL